MENEFIPSFVSNAFEYFDHTGCRQWLRTAAHVRMGNSAGVPKLRNDAAAGGMHGVCDQAPSAHLIRAP
jgi:hypothetical protein